MPEPMDGNFYGTQFSDLEIDPETLADLHENFMKFLPTDQFGNRSKRLDPNAMKKDYEKMGLDKTMPSMYAMVRWMTTINNQTRGIGFTFQEFIEQATFFFTQRHNEEGLRFIFELFDQEKKGYLELEEFCQVFKSLELDMTHQEMKYFFDCATKNKPQLTFARFSKIMKREMAA